MPRPADFRQQVIDETEPRPFLPNTKNVTASTTLLGTQSGSVFTNYGAAGTVTLTLPTRPPIGFYVKLIVAAAQQFGVDVAAADVVVGSGTTGGAGLGYSADDEGESAIFTYIDYGVWAMEIVSGTWTIDS